MKTVACFGSGSGKRGEFEYDRMEEVGRLLARSNIRVATGGYGGSGMEAPIRGARSAEGKTMGYTLACRETLSNRFLENQVVVGTDIVSHPNDDVSQYCLRLACLLRADGFVVDATDKTPGTLIEFLSVVNMNLKFWAAHPKPIVLFYNQFGGGHYLGIAQNFSPRELGSLQFVLLAHTADGAVQWLVEELG